MIKQTLEDLVPSATKYHLAVENRDLKFIENSIPESLEIVDRDGETPLHYAAVNDDIEMCKLLLKINPKLKNIKCIEGKTALDWAFEYYLEYNTHYNLIMFLNT